MAGWGSLVSFFTALLLSLTQAYGGSLGLAIITLSVLVRVALLPLTVRIARRSVAQRRILHSMCAQIAALRKRYKSNPQQLASELSALYRQHGVNPLDRRSLATGALQALVGGGLYSAIRRGIAEKHAFLWIMDLTRPDGILVLV